GQSALPGDLDGRCEQGLIAGCHHDAGGKSQQAVQQLPIDARGDENARSTNCRYAPCQQTRHEGLLGRRQLLKPSEIHNSSVSRAMKPRVVDKTSPSCVRGHCNI
ncbi:MAG: hypothetical protein AB7I48_17680, partial [Planctomycetaceae bacterium]